METKIDRIIKGLNFRFQGSILKFKKSDIENCIEVCLQDSKYIISSTLHLSDRFYEDVERFMNKVFDIVGITWNNTGTIMIL